MINNSSDHVEGSSPFLGEKYLRDVHVADRYGWHRMTTWRRVKTDHTFPKPKRFGPRCSRWALSELLAWENSK
ncbi:AlpA family phage regulatory protein [Ruegeria sp. R14_0]|nr:AlpA family phage regulatory protein [Ruegeria sp. R14_0]